MRVCVLATVTLLVLNACGGGGATSALPSRSGPLVETFPPTPSQNPTLGTFAFVADLRSSNEVPAIADAEASCTGQGRLVLRVTLDGAGKVTAGTAQFSFFVNSCPRGTLITLTHIHRAPSGQNGDVMIDSRLRANDPTAVTNGELGLNTEGTAVADAALLLDIINNPAGYYFNVHSVLHPGGLVRGQLRHET